MIKLIAFDLDGAIGDTVPMCIRAFEKAVSPYAGHMLNARKITRTFGLNEVGTIKKVKKNYTKLLAKSSCTLEDS